MSTLEPGAVIADRYELGRQLGSGGMARVFHARDRKLGREVAVKILSDRYASDPAFVERFRREATSAAGLNHPNIVAVYDRGEVDGSYFIVMEYVPGPDLKRWIRENAPLPPTEAIDVAIEILRALAAAHRRDVIHRDVKPQNVLFTEDGRVKVTDFGIARAGSANQLTEAGLIIGTAQYLSPEQAQGHEVTPASDCYSVGIVLYEMLSGRLPFDGDRPVTVALKQVSEAPPPLDRVAPDVPPRLAAVVMRSLEKRPQARFMHAEDFARALERIRAEIVGEGDTMLLGAQTGETRVIDEATGETRVIRESDMRRARDRRPPPPPRDPPRAARRGASRFLAAGILALIAAVFVGFFLLRGGDGVTVPSVVGLSQADAEEALRNADLEVRLGSPVVSDSVEAGRVVRQSPLRGESVDKGSTVTLNLSSGPESVDVPNVVGNDLDQAKRTLAAADFQVKVADPEFDEDIEKGRVLRQEPSGTAARGATITLTPSAGEETFKVPDIRKLTPDEARAKLEAAGFRLGNQSSRPSRAREGTIIEQRPNFTERAAKGTAVDYVLAEAQVTIPDGLVGGDKDTVIQTLRDLGLRVVSDEAAPTKGEAAGIVLSVSPVSGTVVDRGSTVAVTVSIGPNGGDTVPSVLGDDGDAAKASLEAAGYTVVVNEQDSTEPAGVVIAQDPSAGADSPVNGVITLTVSSGSPPSTNVVPPPGTP